jgi:hypothetical protein
MMKHLGTFVLLIIALSAFGQTETAPTTTPTTTPEKKYARPDIPGTFTIEIGVNNALDKPNRFDLGFWGSRTINFYYQYDLRIMKSRFSLVPGIGFSLERFKFTNNNTLGYDDQDSLKFLTPAEMGLSIKKSQLITNYIDVPIELRYSTRPDDPTRSFKIGIGYRVGYLYEIYTKVKYTEDGDTKKYKDSQNFNLTRFRHGPFVKIGLGNVSLFGYYNMTPLFESKKGPTAGKVASPDFSTFTLGISLASF